MAKYYITPTLLNSWQYNIKKRNTRGFYKSIKQRRI